MRWVEDMQTQIDTLNHDKAELEVLSFHLSCRCTSQTGRVPGLQYLSLQHNAQQLLFAGLYQAQGHACTCSYLQPVVPLRERVQSLAGAKLCGAPLKCLLTPASGAGAGGGAAAEGAGAAGEGHRAGTAAGPEWGRPALRCARARPRQRCPRGCQHLHLADLGGAALSC